MLEEWLNCQRAWLYLEPIFSSEDINRQLPVESKRYQTMERIWRKIMKNAYENREASSHRDGRRAAGALKRFLASPLPEQGRLEDESKALVLAVVPLSGLPSLETRLRNTALRGFSSWRFAVPISIFKGPDKSCSKSKSLALVNCSFLFVCLFLIFIYLFGCIGSWLPFSMWDLSSLTRDRTCVPSISRQILNYWTTREFQP